MGGPWPVMATVALSAGGPMELCIWIARTKGSHKGILPAIISRILLFKAITLMTGHSHIAQCIAGLVIFQQKLLLCVPGNLAGNQLFPV